MICEDVSSPLSFANKAAQVFKHFSLNTWKCVLFDQRETPPSAFQYWQTSHFCVDNDSANHNQGPNGLFRQSEEPGQDGSQLAASPALGQALWGFEADLVFRRLSCVLLLCLSAEAADLAGHCQKNSVLWKALIHHTFLAACHLNAKYFHCIFKSKQEKKWARRTGRWKG